MPTENVRKPKAFWRSDVLGGIELKQLAKMSSFAFKAKTKRCW